MRRNLLLGNVRQGRLCSTTSLARAKRKESALKEKRRVKRKKKRVKELKHNKTEEKIYLGMKRSLAPGYFAREWRGRVGGRKGTEKDITRARRG